MGRVFSFQSTIFIFEYYNMCSADCKYINYFTMKYMKGMKFLIGFTKTGYRGF
jgi:hypothetical protein